MAVLFQGGKVRFSGGAVVFGSSLSDGCCDDDCVVTECAWFGNPPSVDPTYAPLQSSYSLSFTVWLAKGSPDGACEGNQNVPVTGEWVCSDSVSLTFLPSGTRCRYEDNSGDKELCPDNTDLDGSGLPAGWTEVISGSYLRYLPASDEWEIGMSIQMGGGSPITLTATAPEDEIRGPPSSGWTFEVSFKSGTFGEDTCWSVLTDATPQYQEIMIGDWTFG